MSISYGIGNVSLGTAQTFEHIGSGFNFRIQGDGAFEPQVRDQFARSPQALNGVDEQRLKNLLADFASKRNDRVAEQASYEASGHKHLGSEWNVTSFYPGAGSIGRVDLEMSTPEGSRQVVYMEYRGGTPELWLSAHTNQAGWTVRQDVQCNVNPDGSIVRDSISEGGHFARP